MPADFTALNTAIQALTDQATDNRNGGGIRHGSHSGLCRPGSDGRYCRAHRRRCRRPGQYRRGQHCHCRCHSAIRRFGRHSRRRDSRQHASGSRSLNTPQARRRGSGALSSAAAPPVVFRETINPCSPCSRGTRNRMLARKRSQNCSPATSIPTIRKSKLQDRGTVWPKATCCWSRRSTNR